MWKNEKLFEIIDSLYRDDEFLDYSKWLVPMDERADAYHLNSKGAVHFTEELSLSLGL